MLSIVFVLSLVTGAALAIAADIIGKGERSGNLFSGRPREGKGQRA
jgi:hypothetical protein